MARSIEKPALHRLVKGGHRLIQAVRPFFIPLLVIYVFLHFTYYLHITFTVEEGKTITHIDNDSPMIVKNGLVVYRAMGRRVRHMKPVRQVDKIITKRHFHKVKREYVEYPSKGVQTMRPYLHHAAKDIWREGNGSMIYFTLLNDAYVNLLDNWLCNTVIFEDFHQNVIIIPFLQTTCDNLNERWGDDIKCLALKIDGYKGEHEVGSQKWKHILTMRAELLAFLTSYDIPYLSFEVDSVWFKDPRLKLGNLTDGDSPFIAGQKRYHPEDEDETKKNQTLNFTPLFVNPTNITKAFMNELVERMKKNEDLTDEDILNDLCQEGYSDLGCDMFSSKDFIDGGWYKLSPREKKETIELISAHNNAYDGAKDKEGYMTLSSLFFLSKKGSHCVYAKVKKNIKTYFDPPKD